ncbi:MAG: hypothetical protein ACJA02_000208 [Myxococcota bacterium]|jgi:hypothetical protein
MINFFSKIVSLAFIFFISSCSSQKTPTNLTFDTYPKGAKVYIDDVYYGDTVKQVRLIASKDYRLRLDKDGYQSIESEIKTKFSLRPKNTAKRIKCRLNFIGSVLIFPIFSLKNHCLSFTKTVYQFKMVRSQSQNLQTNMMSLDPDQNPYQDNGSKGFQYQGISHQGGLSSQPPRQDQYQKPFNPESIHYEKSETPPKNVPDYQRNQINNHYSTPYQYYDTGQVPQKSGVDQYQSNERELNYYQETSQRNYLQINSREN